jgi:hypothetical protein
MSNHYHLIIYTDPATERTWSDDEVIDRCRLSLGARPPQFPPHGLPSSVNVWHRLAGL